MAAKTELERITELQNRIYKRRSIAKKRVKAISKMSKISKTLKREVSDLIVGLNITSSQLKDLSIKKRIVRNTVGYTRTPGKIAVISSTANRSKISIINSNLAGKSRSRRGTKKTISVRCKSTGRNMGSGVVRDRRGQHIKLY